MTRLEQYGGGVMLIVAGVAFELVLLLTPAARAREGEVGARLALDRVVRAIESQYNNDAKNLPIMGVATLCAKTATERRRFDHVERRRCI